MDSNIDDGGPAFPCSREGLVAMANGVLTDATIVSSGLSIRDYFAARSMEALIGKGEHWRVDKSRCGDAKCFSRTLLPLPTVADYPRLARISYAIADAMLEARKR